VIAEAEALIHGRSLSAVSMQTGVPLTLPSRVETELYATTACVAKLFHQRGIARYAASTRRHPRVARERRLSEVEDFVIPSSSRHIAQIQATCTEHACRSPDESPLGRLANRVAP
jgi:hypothetical protein